MILKSNVAAGIIDMQDERENLPSASGMARLVNCPGSWNAEQAIEKVDTSSAVSTFGNEVHAAIAAEDLSGCGIKESDVAERLMRMEKAAIEQWQQDFGVGTFNTLREVRFWLSVGGRRVASGKPDLFAQESGKLTFAALDFKTGFKDVVASSRNWQLKFFVAFAWALALETKGADTSTARIRVAIAQHRLGEKFDATDYDAADMKQTYNEVMFFLRRAQNPDAERIPSIECGYCKARTSCPEFAGYCMMPMLHAKMVDVLPKKAEVEARVALLPLEALAFIESRRTVATNLFKAVSDRLKGLPADALAALGLELKASGGTRSIPDLGALWAILERNKLCTGEEFRAMCDISIGALEEKLVPRIKLVQELPSNKAAEDVLKALIEPVVVKGLPSQTLKKK